MVSAIIVNMPEEAFNDAQYFKEKAQAQPDEVAFARWRWVRASIIFSWWASESSTNLFKQWCREEDRKDLERRHKRYLSNDQGYQELKRLRNGLLHYQGETLPWAEMAVENATMSIEAARRVIKKRFELQGIQPPEWITQTRSREIR